jgi:hypothetical protein
MYNAWIIPSNINQTVPASTWDVSEQRQPNIDQQVDSTATFQEYSEGRQQNSANDLANIRTSYRHYLPYAAPNDSYIYLLRN